MSFSDGAIRNLGECLAPVFERPDMLLANLDGQIGLEDLARVCGLSRAHFARAFKIAVGRAHRRRPGLSRFHAWDHGGISLRRNPWFVVIAPDGRVVYDGFGLDAAALVTAIQPSAAS